MRLAHSGAFGVMARMAVGKIAMVQSFFLLFTMRLHGRMIKMVLAPIGGMITANG